MNYAIKEIFGTIQGEGHHTGTAAVFIRFAGCNFWSGREKDRFTSSLCPFCDTDFVGTDGVLGGRYEDANAVVEAARQAAPRAPIAVLTGGEPLLQLDKELLDALVMDGFNVHVETNGSIDTDLDIDWLTCSPKSIDQLALSWCHELKVIYPAQAKNLEQYHRHFWTKADHCFVQPEDGPGDRQTRSMRECVEFVRENPAWRVSVQMHKILGVP